MTEIGDYELEGSIGEGSFAVVRLATHKITRSKVAVKIIPRTNFSDESHDRFEREVDLIKDLDHPFIAEFFDVVQDSNNFYVIMEYVENGNLLELVNENGELPEDQARHYFCQLISVLEYLHEEKHIAHRDLKAENVLLDRNKNIRLIDFGLSNIFSQDNPYLQTACGSPAYACPEMIKGQQYTSASDIWSAGILLYAIVIGELPFEDDNMQRLLQKIIYTDPKYPSSISPQLTDLLKRMLTKDPDNRITLNKIKEHPWFSQFEYSGVIMSASQKWCVRKDEFIDRDILKQMTDYGYDCGNLVSDLICEKISPMTAVYRMLRKNKITDMLKEASYSHMKAKERLQPPGLSSTPRFRPIPPPIPIPSGPSGPTSPKANPRMHMKSSESSTGAPMSARGPRPPSGTGAKVPLPTKPPSGARRAPSPAGTPPQALIDSAGSARKTVKPVPGQTLQRKRSSSMTLDTAIPIIRPK